MWYAVFNRSLVELLFAAASLLAYLSLHMKKAYSSGPFFFLLPLPLGIVYFWRYCDSIFQKKMVGTSVFMRIV